MFSRLVSVRDNTNGLVPIPTQWRTTPKKSGRIGPRKYLLLRAAAVWASLAFKGNDVVPKIVRMDRNFAFRVEAMSGMVEDASCEDLRTSAAKGQSFGIQAKRAPCTSLSDTFMSY